ncbi:hypothetical protein [Rhodopseudomonas sp.]|uniref:hypothetical protein n=1 Tax=Rhodopseudomonas sp. TaxID=1078 RepID=UPI0039E644C3
MSQHRKSIEQVVSALQLAPYAPAPGHWMAALEGLAEATNSRHAEMICWKQPKVTPFKMISHLGDEQAAIIRNWEAHIGADPVVNPIIAKGISMPVLQALSDEEVIRSDERERHIVWNEFYFRVDMHHMCFTPLWRGDDSVLGLFLLRSRRDGPVKSNERRLFMQAAWICARICDACKKSEGRRRAGARRSARHAFDPLSHSRWHRALHAPFAIGRVASRGGKSRISPLAATEAGQRGEGDCAVSAGRAADPGRC